MDLFTKNSTVRQQKRRFLQKNLESSDENDAENPAELGKPAESEKSSSSTAKIKEPDIENNEQLIR